MAVHTKKRSRGMAKGINFNGLLMLSPRNIWQVLRAHGRGKPRPYDALRAGMWFQPETDLPDLNTLLPSSGARMPQLLVLPLRAGRQSGEGIAKALEQE